MSDLFSKVENNTSARVKSSASVRSRLNGAGWVKFVWPLLAVILFLMSTVFAINQPPRSDPWKPVDKWSADWFLHPVETNAFKRLPTVLGDLTDIFALADGENIWAVGDGGLILHSSDGGKHWEQQNPSRTAIAAEKVEGLIPSAYAMDASYSVKEAGSSAQRQQVAPFLRAQQALPSVEQKLLKEKLDKRKKYLATKNLKGRNPSTSKVSKALRRKTKDRSIAPPPARPNLYKSDLTSIYFVNAQRGWAVGARGTILTTSNGGATWDEQISGSDALLSAVYMQPDGQRGWIVGTSGLILSTNNGGETWEKQTSGSNAWLTSIQMQSDDQRGWIVGEDGTILSTSNGGGTWEQQDSASDALLLNIQMQSDGQRGWIVGTSGLVLSTSNGGGTWKKQTSGADADLYSIHMQTDGQRGWVVGAKGTILFTSNGGRTWQKQTSGADDFLYAIRVQSDGQRGWVVGAGGMILSTSNGGGTWEKQTNGSNARFTSVHIQADGQRGWVIVSKGLILFTSDGGKTWEKQTSNSNADFYAMQMLSNGQRGWVVGGAGTILSTSNGGKVWGTQSSGTDARLTSIQVLTDGQRGWVVGAGGTILSTGNGGKSWEKQRSDSNVDFSAIQMQADGQRGWIVGADGTILVTGNGGRIWDKQSSGSDVNFSSIQMLSDGQRGWVVGAGGTILSTGNGGKTWEKQRSDSNAYFSAIQMMSDGQRGWIVGAGGTILSTSNGGKSWEKQRSDSNVDFSAIQMQADGQRGWIVGDGGTILSTSNAGESWQSELDAYSVSPAPWYYLITFLCTLLLCFTAGRLAGKEISASEAEGSTETIINKSVSDKPAGPGSPDYLGALKIARGLARFISNRDTIPPVTMAITGDWGSGKSSVMNYLCAQLRRDGLKPVWFNAWHHREEGNVLASMLENVRRQAIPRTPYGLYIRLRLLLKRHWIFKLASVALLFGAVFAAAIFTDAAKRDATWHYVLYSIGVEQPVALSKHSIETFCKTGLSEVRGCSKILSEIIWIPPKNNTPVLDDKNSFSSNSNMLEKIEQLLGNELSKEQESVALKAAVHPSPEVPFSISSTLVSFIGTLFGLIALLIIKGASIVGVGTTGIIQNIIRMAGLERSKEPVGTRQLFERQFRQITELFGKRRLVLFIDDLDRCEKDYTMKVLETTNFLASSGDLFMVIGMAPRYVLANVNLHFSALAEAVHEVEMDNNHVSPDSGEHATGKASFARRYLQKLINIEVPVPKGKEESTRNMLLGESGEMDADGAMEMKLRQFIAYGKALFWAVVLVVVTGLAWQLATDQKNENVLSVSAQQHVYGLEQLAVKKNLTDTRQGIVKKGAGVEPKQSGSKASLIAGDPFYRDISFITVSTLLVGMILLVFILVWRYRDKREKLMALLKPLGIAIAGPSQTNDSESFSDALKIWNEVLFKADSNPRKIKVFLNHLRYVSSQMFEEGDADEFNLVGIAVMFYVFGKDIESLDRESLLAANTYASLCSDNMPELIGKAWKAHKSTFNSLPAEKDWNRYLEFINDVEIHQPHYREH